MKSGPHQSIEPVEDSHPNPRVFVWVFVALCGLTLVSVLLASFQIFPNQTVTWLAFLSVAVIKASLVICYFMHLRWEKVWKYFLTIPALILGIALVLSLLPDVGMRSNFYSSDRANHGPEITVDEVQEQ